MDILVQSEMILRPAGYETRTWSGGRVPVLCFENASVLGFLHVFPSTVTLVKEWEQVQRVTLARFVSALKLSGAKAWNVYSVFLSEDDDTAANVGLDSIEEDFRLTRKIARSGVRSSEDLQQALLSLLPIVSQPTLSEINYSTALRTRLADLPTGVSAAFVGDANPKDVAEMLRES